MTGSGPPLSHAHASDLSSPVPVVSLVGLVLGRPRKERPREREGEGFWWRISRGVMSSAVDSVFKNSRNA